MPSTSTRSQKSAIPTFYYVVFGIIEPLITFASLLKGTFCSGKVCTSLWIPDAEPKRFPLGDLSSWTLAERSPRGGGPAIYGAPHNHLSDGGCTRGRQFSQRLPPKSDQKAPFASPTRKDSRIAYNFPGYRGCFTPVRDVSWNG